MVAADRLNNPAKDEVADVWVDRPCAWLKMMIKISIL